MAVLLYQFWNYPDYQVEGAKVTGLKRIAAEDLEAVSRPESGSYAAGASIGPLALESLVQRDRIAH